MDIRELFVHGHTTSHQLIAGFLRTTYPLMPEDWVLETVDQLLSVDQLAFTAAHLGLKDLVFYANQNSSDPIGDSSDQQLVLFSGPPNNQVLADCLLALVGALMEENKPERARLFIRDFILSRLVELDWVNELDQPKDPMLLLTGVLVSQGRDAPEARLQNQSSMNTLLACYQVGIYSNRQLIGEAPGETIDVAEHEAAMQALRNLFGLNENRPALKLNGSLAGDQWVAQSDPNPSLSDYLELARKQAVVA